MIRLFCYLLFISLVFLFLGLPASAQTSPSTGARASDSPPPDLVIVVWDTGDGPSRVALSFARQVEPRALERSIAGLGAGQGWKITEIAIRDDFSPEKQEQTSASFYCQGIVDRSSGKLALEPLLAAFGGEGNFRVAFVVPGMTNFSGPTAFHDERWEVQLFTGEGIYEYEVRPVPGAELASPLPSARMGEMLKIGLILLILLLSGGLVVVVVVLWYGMKNKALTRK